MSCKLYAAYNTSDEARANGSSGGAFAALAGTTLRRGGQVFGAELALDPDGNWACRHVRCDTKAELKRVLRSKYMPSDTEEAFREIQNRLSAGNEVLYCGTPCQVAGLLCFLGKPYENLTTVDLICHGVPTPLLFSKLVAETEEKTREKVVRFNFRDKSGGWRNPVFSTEAGSGRITPNNGLRLYIMNMYLRSSCYRCRFKGWERKSDLTLGDFWGVEEFLPLSPEDLHRGVSIVLAHTPKGQALFTEAAGTLKTYPVGKEVLRKKNSPFRKSPFKPLDRWLYHRLFFRLKTDDLLKLYGLSDGFREFLERNLEKAARVFKRLRPRRKHGERRLPKARDCCGCMACYAACPFDAISIRQDRFGFRYPLISPDLCRHCGKCLAACPLVETDKSGG